LRLITAAPISGIPAAESASRYKPDYGIIVIYGINQYFLITGDGADK
jgi:hypothetical protein